MIDVRPAWRALPVALFGALVAVAPARAADAPTTYTVTSQQALATPHTARRSGSVVVVDTPAVAAFGDSQPPSPPLRAHYDLAAGRVYTWDPTRAAPYCQSAAIGADGVQGDPLSAAPFDPAAQKGRKVGRDRVGGVAADKYVFPGDADPATKRTLWIEPRSGVVVRTALGRPVPGAAPYFDVQHLDFDAPDPAFLALPPPCARLAALPRIPDMQMDPTTAGLVAALIGAGARDYVAASAATHPARIPCDVVLSVVKARTLQPIGDGVMVSVSDASGAMRDRSADLKDGVLTLSAAPDRFRVTVAFVDGRWSAYRDREVVRQCFGRPVSHLLFVAGDIGQAFPFAEWIWRRTADAPAKP